MNKLNRIVSVVLSAATILSFTSCSSQGGESVEVSELRCRNLENPEGVDRASFSWEIESNLPNVTQSAWEIEIASNKKLLEKGKADIWQSGKQLSDQQLNVEPTGAQLQAGASYWWRVRIWTGSDEMTSWSDPAYFSLGLDSSQWKGQWITAEWEEGAPLPYFRKTFDASKAGTQPVRAVVYLSGLGCSDLFFNGQRVDSTRILDPAQTNYEQYALYSTFDVTPLLQKGNNCIGVMLGDGWYNQGKVWGPGFSYGKPILFAQMEITYKDGSTLTVATDETWEWTPGPILSSNIYAGEVYDANKEIKGWAVADTQLEGWKPARIASGVIPQRLEPQLIEPIRMQEVIDPVDLWHKLFFIVDGALVDTLIACYGLSNVCQINGVPQLRPSFEAMMELGYATPAVHRRAAVIFHQFVESCSEILHERTLSARPEALELKKTIDGSIGKRFRLNAFSRQVGYSPAHLIRRFREAFGCSPYEYLMQRRIETARQLLSFSRKSVKEIAEMLGFADQYSFSGSFKARTGVSPSHYRRRG